MYPTKKSLIDIDELLGPEKAEEDLNLARYFIQSNQYRSIVKGTKDLILGRKGSGKSALYCYLIHQLKNEGCITIGICPSGEDFVKINSVLNTVAELSLKNDFKYSMAWEDIILSEIASQMVDEIDDEDIKTKINKYLVINGKAKPDFYKRFIKSMLSVTKSGKIKTPILDIDLNFENISSLNQTDQEEIKKMLLGLITKKSIYVLFDHLDEP